MPVTLCLSFLNPTLNLNSHAADRRISFLILLKSCAKLFSSKYFFSHCNILCKKCCSESLAVRCCAIVLPPCSLCGYEESPAYTVFNIRFKVRRFQYIGLTPLLLFNFSFSILRRTISCRYTAVLIQTK